MADLKRSLSKKMKDSLAILKPSSSTSSSADENNAIHPTTSLSSSIATCSNTEFIYVTPLPQRPDNMTDNSYNNNSGNVSQSPVGFPSNTSSATSRSNSSPSVLSNASNCAATPSPTSSKSMLPNASNSTMATAANSMSTLSMSTLSMSSLSMFPTSSTSTSVSTIASARPAIAKGKSSTSSLPALLRNRSLRKLRLLNNAEDASLSSSTTGISCTQQQQKFNSISSPNVPTLQSIKTSGITPAIHNGAVTTIQSQSITAGDVLNSADDVPISPVAATAAEAAAVVVQVLDNGSNSASNKNGRNNSDCNINVSTTVPAPFNKASVIGTKISLESNEVSNSVSAENANAADAANLKLDLLPPNPLVSPVSEDQLSPILPSRLTSPVAEYESFFFTNANDTSKSLSMNNIISERQQQHGQANNFHFFNEVDELDLERQEQDDENDTQHTDDDFENSISIQRSSCNNLNSRSRQNSLATSLSSSTNNMNNNNGNISTHFKIPTAVSNNTIVAPAPPFLQHHRGTRTNTYSSSTTTNNNTSGDISDIIYDDSLINSTIISNTSASNNNSTSNSAVATSNSEALLGYFNDPIMSNMINNNRDLINGSGSPCNGNDDMGEDTKYYELEEAFCDEIAFDILGKVEHIDDICDNNTINAFGSEDYFLKLKNGCEW